MSQIGRKMLVVLAVVALVVPAAAVANHGSSHGKGKGKGKGKTHNVAWVFKGTVTSVDTTESLVSVEVKGGNARVRKPKSSNYIGDTVSFNLANARLVVADVNTAVVGPDVGDIQIGDRVLVKCMLPKKDPGSEPFAAKKLVDQTHPPAS